MIRKIAISSIAGLLIAGVVTAVPASAAAKISNGVPCTKSGATSKTSNGTYKCAKNPTVKNSKLTWLSTDCLTTANSYVKALGNLQRLRHQQMQLLHNSMLRLQQHKNLWQMQHSIFQNSKLN